MSRESLNKALFLGGALLGYHQIPMNLVVSYHMNLVVSYQ